MTSSRRILRPGGRLIVSVDHPFAIHAIHRQAGQTTNYFATYNWTEQWVMGGQTATMSFWNRPLHAMTDAFTAADFHLCAISEPQPQAAAREVFPDEYEGLGRKPILSVLRDARRLMLASWWVSRI
ncbi:conserved hypothetical protein [uncultured Mycobacterium sp.]|uniref:Uncharacterized protein n=1 Tax=uncultured Mycobacterium sp. TaxID=171292 RepID=A0A1Y5PTR9_9MYCO|nr:hypothetical protein MycrhDRAFT_6986 [Mycolicibacterium rhodesiae JS60]SBS79601.1 conserved hypothetical protein [uncultured Mycobacterium sp.]